jgi:hypothetical protein
MKTPGSWNLPTAGRRKIPVLREVLEHAEHDRANKGQCDIRGNNAQFADQSHEKTSQVQVTARGNAEANNRFPPEKVSAPVARGVSAAANRRSHG